MIMVESRFRVANGMEEAVRNTFLDRPGLVDDVTGFLSMEVYAASDDHCVFHLVTRWTDHAAYDVWHRSDAHHRSHAFIPRGVTLDATFTRLTLLERLASVAGASGASGAPTVRASRGARAGRCFRTVRLTGQMLPSGNFYLPSGNII